MELSGDEFRGLSEASELENRVPVVDLVTIDGDNNGLGGDDCVGHSQNMVGSVEPRVRFSGSDRESSGAVEVTRR